uniref:uncharacterized protein LOC122603476 n=1 Tax=Erigeron canadensis TaxID=72917 RepID=UPI001CB91041|nr:uncharacterized protein LOC122603476 [Erigeron canadensis]
MRKGSTRVSNVMRQTDRGSDGIWNKASKNLKSLNCVDDMDNNSIYSKRLKLSKKTLDNCHPVYHVSVPKKLRSALQKRQTGYVSPSSPSLSNGISRFEMPSEDSNKKLKDEEQQSTVCKLIMEQITISEEEAIAGLLSLPRIYARSNTTLEINLNNKISEESSMSEDLVNKCVQIDDLNQSTNTVDVKKDSIDNKSGNKSRKRCMSHVYICRIIKELQFMEDKTVISHIQMKTDPASENMMNSRVGINLNEAITANKTEFQYQRRACKAQPYFGNPFYDPSQWSRPVFPRQQMLMNPFITAHSGYVQPTMLDALGAKQEYKMQYGQCSMGYEENGGLLHVDIPSALKLTL